jgi:hypothetical protein
MTDEQINAAIAQECGWENVCQHPKNPNVWVGKHWSLLQEVPDFCIDLNAMHEAEKVLTREQINAFCEKLFPTNYCGVWWSIHATARQRAEAFLRTLGKWEDGE